MRNPDNSFNLQLLKGNQLYTNNKDDNITDMILFTLRMTKCHNTPLHLRFAATLSK